MTILQQIYTLFHKVKARKPKDFADTAYYCLWSTFSCLNIGTRLGLDPVDVYHALSDDGHVFYLRGDDYRTAVCKTLDFIDYEKQLLFMGTDAKWAKVQAEMVDG